VDDAAARSGNFVRAGADFHTSVDSVLTFDDRRVDAWQWTALPHPGQIRPPSLGPGCRATTYASERLLVGESRVGVGPPLGLGLRFRLCSRLAGLGRRIG
jgi:hypothetical protein